MNDFKCQFFLVLVICFGVSHIIRAQTTNEFVASRDSAEHLKALHELFSKAPPHFNNHLKHLRLPEESLMMLNVLASMLDSMSAFPEIVPKGAQLLSVQQWIGLISKSFLETPYMDEKRLNRMLEIWKNKLYESSDFFTLYEPHFNERNKSTIQDLPGHRSQNKLPYIFPQIPQFYSTNV